MNYFVWGITLLGIVPTILATCPSRCRCTHFLLGLYDSVECSNLSLTELPWGNLDDILGKLDLSFNKITILKNNTFLDREISFLDKLMLNNNQITTIEVHAFRGMKHLTYLNLRHNNITTIHPEVFKGIQELRVLNINNNPQLLLPETGLHLPVLSVLDMSECGLSSVPDNFFVDMKSLDILTLYGNQLTFFDSKLAAPLTKLEYLDLGGNRFIQLQVELLKLPHTVDIELKGNPFHCDCALVKAYSIYKTRVHNEILVCKTPENMNLIEPNDVNLTNLCIASSSNVRATGSIHIFSVLVLAMYLKNLTYQVV